MLFALFILQIFLNKQLCKCLLLEIQKIYLICTNLQETLTEIFIFENFLFNIECSITRINCYTDYFLYIWISDIGINVNLLFKASSEIGTGTRSSSEVRNAGSCH